MDARVFAMFWVIAGVVAIVLWVVVMVFDVVTLSG